MNNFMPGRVCDIVAETFDLNPREVDAGSSAQTLAAWTSLAHLRLMANLEQAFDVRFTMDEMAAMSSVSAIENVLTARNVTA